MERSRLSPNSTPSSRNTPAHAALDIATLIAKMR